MLKMGEWSAHFLATSARLPVTFKLDGKTISGIPDDWNPVARKYRIDANIIETIFEGTDAETGLNLRVECLEYLDYPVVEWVAWLTNKGQKSTPVISDLLALDGIFTGISPVLCHCNGEFMSAEGLTSLETPLHKGDLLVFAPTGGRPCDRAFPYYRIVFEGWGLSMAIGWPAQWAASFSGLADGVQVRAGQEKIHLRLMPGESIRTPRMTVLAWAGDASRAVNLWRRWYLTHILPRPNGQSMKRHLACCGTDEGEEFTAATEENQIRYIDKFNRLGIHPDVWWIDAGWYPCDPAVNMLPSVKLPGWSSKWWITGTWEPDSKRFPRGLKPVSDHTVRVGADLLVWFEPERVIPGSKLDVEHPEWLLHSSIDDERQVNFGGLLNLGDRKCREWLTDHVCQLIKDNGIKIYRQDFNFEILSHWRQNESQDRQGLNENLYVQGYLQYWDDLLARNPGLWIDSCSSGGRRNDLETLRRSVPLHYTDFGYGDHPVKLAFQHTMFEWMPYFKECTLSWDIGGNARFDHQVDSYSFHCAMAPMLFLSLDIRRDDYDYALARQMIGIWRRAADLILNGDYYPLTPLGRTPEQWVARQFDCPEKGQGFIQAIRLPAALQETLVVRPQALDAEAVYRFENMETGENMDLAGVDWIRDGFNFALPSRSGAIWFYQQIGGKISVPEPAIKPAPGTWMTIFGKDPQIMAVDGVREGQWSGAMWCPFSGTSVKLLASTGPGNGKADIYVDGLFRTTADWYSAQDVYDVLIFSVLDLPDGKHLLGIQTRGDKCVESSGTAINWSRIEYLAGSHPERFVPVKRTCFEPNVPLWLDDRGEQIQCHMGGVMFHQGRYYMVGGDWRGQKLPGFPYDWGKNFGMVVYSSTDLMNWTWHGNFCGQSGDPYQPLYNFTFAAGRGKLLCARGTGKFIALFQVVDAYFREINVTAVAVADTPEGPYKWYGILQMDGKPVQGADTAVFTDDDGTQYLITGQRIADHWNVADCLYELAPDCLSAVKVTLLQTGGEAPAIFKHEGVYYLLHSHLTGLGTNDNFYHTATDIHGPWQAKGHIACGEHAADTFQTQTTDVVPVAGKKNAFIWIGDSLRANKAAPYTRTVWLPITLKGKGEMEIRWYDSWDLSVFKK